MAKARATVAVILYKSKTLKNGEHPLMVRVTQNRRAKYYSLGISCDPKYWNFEKQEPRKNHPDKDVLNAIIAQKKESYLNQILSYKQKAKNFTPDVLINKVEKTTTPLSVLQYFDNHIEKLERAKRVGYADIFRNTKNDVAKFLKGKEITFDQIDENWLCAFESFLRERDLLNTSLSVKFRTLRTLYKDAIKNGQASKEDNPFSAYKISERFNTSTRKRAIKREDIKAIEALEYKPYSAIFEAQQFFLFSYYAQGINFADMAHLKWQDIEAGRVTYRRKKTGELISFKLSDPLNKILNYWRPFTANSPDNYIFPILKKGKHITAQQKYDRTKKVLRRVNRDLKEIGKKIGLDTPLTTYVARHSFATVLKQAGVSIAIISETLGHQTEAITKTYLKSFEDSAIDQALENL